MQKMALKKPAVKPALQKPAEPEEFEFELSTGKDRDSHRTIIYGSGGVGKTSLAANITGIGKKPVFIDLEHGSIDMEVTRVKKVDCWEMLRGILQKPANFKDFDVIVIDSFTVAQELCSDYVVRTIPTEKNKKAKRIGDYGYGGGYRHIFDNFKKLLSDLDHLALSGKNIIAICHDATEKVPNPAGEDFLRWTMNLQSSSSYNLCMACKNWTDHLLFLCFDRIAEDGKAVGGQTRTIYALEQAHFMAKSRTIKDDQFNFATPDDATVWKAIFQ